MHRKARPQGQGLRKPAPVELRPGAVQHAHRLPARSTPTTALLSSRVKTPRWLLRPVAKQQAKIGLRASGRAWSKGSGSGSRSTTPT